MSDIRKYLLQAAGYLFFFCGLFLVFLYFTFDPDVLVPALQKQASKKDVRLSIRDASMHGLFGLAVKGLSIESLKSDAPPGSAVSVDSLVLSPSLGSLIRAASSGANASLDFHFQARMGSGSIRGEVKSGPDSIEIPELDVDDLPLQMLPIARSGMEGLELSGKLKARVRELALNNLKRPETWQGEIQVEVERPAVSDFQFSGIQVVGFDMERASLKARMQKGKMKIEKLELKGDAMPMDLKGDVSLKRPLGRSVMKLDGTIRASESYKQKMPVISGLLPPNGKYSYNGPLNVLVSGI